MTIYITFGFFLHKVRGPPTRVLGLRRNALKASFSMSYKFYIIYILSDSYHASLTFSLRVDLRPGVSVRFRFYKEVAYQLRYTCVNFQVSTANIFEKNRLGRGVCRFVMVSFSWVDLRIFSTQNKTQKEFAPRVH